MDYLDFEKNEKGLDHFWYKARNDLILKIFSKNKIKKALILDIGCGVGSQLEILKQFSSQLSGMDVNKLALDEAQRRGYSVFQADIESWVDLEEKYDIICAFDILEHLNKDSLALKNIYKMLKPQGFLIFSVPVCKRIFSDHDSFLQHKRRYSRSEIKQKIIKTGFEIQDIFYWNSILLPFIALKRILFKNSQPKSDFKSLNKIINSVFFNILKFENNLIIRKLRAPFGLSVFGIAQK